MSTKFIEQEKQIILIIMYIYIILIYFKIIVSCVCSNPPSPYAVFFKKKASISIGTFVINLLNPVHRGQLPPPKVPPYLIFTLIFLTNSVDLLQG